MPRLDKKKPVACWWIIQETSHLGGAVYGTKAQAEEKAGPNRHWCVRRAHPMSTLDQSRVASADMRDMLDWPHDERTIAALEDAKHEFEQEG